MGTKYHEQSTKMGEEEGGITSNVEELKKACPCHFACLPWQERRSLSAVAEEVYKLQGKCKTLRDI